MVLNPGSQTFNEESFSSDAECNLPIANMDKSDCQVLSQKEISPSGEGKELHLYHYQRNRDYLPDMNPVIDD